MADYQMRHFRAQVAMDSVLRTAMIEIAKIFESSLHGHHMEMAQKQEEIALLKLKLQSAELKLKECQNDADRRAENNQIQIDETQREPENTPRQTSHVPEIDFEVPDDWCAPLGSENLTKQHEDACPSVRLRRLSIPLWHVPVIKKEVEVNHVNHDRDSDQPTKAGRKSKRISALSESQKHTPDKSPPGRTQRPPVRNDMKHLLQEIKQEYSGPAVITGQRRRGQSLTGKEPENVTKCKVSRSERGKKATPEPRQKEMVGNSRKWYSCKFCHKEFDSEVGRNLHVESHKRCRGCKKVFPFPSGLVYHKTSCQKLKKLSSKGSESCDKEKLSTPSKKQYNLKRDSAPSSDSCSESTRRKHKDQMKSRGDLGWTRPLEELEDNGEGLILPSKDANSTANFNNVQTENRSDTIPEWQTMGTQGPDGYSCLRCQKLLKKKSLLIEHFYIHTGEKPIKCEKCPKRFRTRSQLYKHRKRCCFPLRSILCQQCGKNFPTQKELNRHLIQSHRDWPHVCQDCGKGFLIEGPLKNHIERFHTQT